MRAATLAETGGATQGSSRRFALASVKVGQKPQEGRRPRFATVENADGPAIKTLQHPLAVRVPLRKGRHSGTGEVQERGARQHALVAEPERALKRDPGAGRPCTDRKIRVEPARSRVNPRSAAGNFNDVREGGAVRGRIEGEARRREGVKP